MFQPSCFDSKDKTCRTACNRPYGAIDKIQAYNEEQMETELIKNLLVLRILNGVQRHVL